MSEAILVTKVPDFTGTRFTRSQTGHVHSPWFTFQTDRETRYDIGSDFHRIKQGAIEAFALAVGVKANRIIISVRENADTNFETWWRLGTVDPIARPAQPTTNPLRDGAIEL